MYPILLEGDTVLVKKQSDFENGNIVVALINGNEATIKKARKLEDGLKLIPFNREINPETQEPYCEDKTFTKKEIKDIPVKIIGVVKKLIERDL